MFKFTYVARPILLASLAIASVSTLPGCGLLVVGGAAATTAAVVNDRRTPGQIVEDKTIQIKASSEMNRLFGDRARVNSTAYGGLLLLTGDVPTEGDKQKAEEAARKVDQVKKVVNAIRVGEITPLSVRSNDTWITSKVTAKLIETTGVPTRTIDITTERGIVYLLGIVTDTEGRTAATAASTVTGVNKVVKLFEVVSPESLTPSQTQAPVQNATTPAASTTAPAGSSGGAETMPIK